MATWNKIYNFVEAVHHGKHDLSSDQLVVELLDAAPSQSDVALTDISGDAVSYTYCSTRNLTRTSSGQTGGNYDLILEDLLLRATGGSVGPFRYVMITNPTATSNELIGWYDYGSDITIVNGDGFLIDLDNVNGLFGAS